VQYIAQLVRIDRARVARAVLADVGELHLDGTFLPVMRDALHAIMRNDAAAVADATDHYVAAGATVLAAENAAAAWVIARAIGEDPAVQSELQRRAVDLRAPLAELSTPGLTAAPPDTPLSRREHEIATLVAAGRTSREVAAELVIGVRTVESHLARVFDKLGIRSRAELPDALRARGLDPVTGGARP
jgi:DNA-binding NarL/FixJ family response regulator